MILIVDGSVSPFVCCRNCIPHSFGFSSVFVSLDLKAGALRMKNMGDEGGCEKEDSCMISRIDSSFLRLPLLSDLCYIPIFFTCPSDAIKKAFVALKHTVCSV